MNTIFSKEPKVKFDAQSLFQGHLKVTYRGIKAIKCPFDYVLYQMLLWELKPDLIIEVGTNKGGAALYYADILDMIGKGEVHTIDIVAGQSDPLLENHPRIKLFEEGYQGYKLDLVKGFDTILVIEDGSHTYEDTLAAITKFAPIVSKDSFLIVEDGIINELGFRKLYNGGPLKAIHEFLDTNKDYIIDRRWCDWFGANATFNVDGFLKKIN